jgi:hypothetical protein
MAASEAIGWGYGGVSMVRRACGLSRKAIAKGIREIHCGEIPSEGRIRRPGGGRKKITVSDPALLAALEPLIETGTRGDPESPLRWICKSTRTLAAQLTKQDHPISYVKVAQLLREQNYSLQSNRKTEEGEGHPDRDAQFRHINTCVKNSLAAGMPVISVDTKKKDSSATTIMRASNGLRPNTLARSAGMTFLDPKCPGLIPTAFLTWAATPDL